VAVVDDRTILAEKSLQVSGSHATCILSLIREVLDCAASTVRDLDLIAVSSGPGSFTGLRIALSVAKGLSLAAAVPAVGVPTLEAIVRAKGPQAGLVCPVLDARKGEVYAAAYRWTGRSVVCVEEAVVLPAGDLPTWQPMANVVMGDGVAIYGDLWRERFNATVKLTPSSDIQGIGSSVAALGRHLLPCEGSASLHRLEPFYVRRPEAEIQLDRRLESGGSDQLHRRGEN
jgi:tRNA threonylcarbamoyladenosine biosynthesis protein TsaB